MNRSTALSSENRSELTTDEFSVSSTKLTRTKFRRLIGKKIVKQPSNYRTKKNSREKTYDGTGKSIEYVDASEEISLEDVLAHESAVLNPILHSDQETPLTTKEQLLKQAIANPLAVNREICKRDLGEFIKYFWDVVAHDTLSWNWHIPYICSALTHVAENVAVSKPREYDLIINIPPGMTKSLTCSVMFPIWCWTRWPWMRFICASYSSALSLEQADYSRELIRSHKFKQLFPEITIKEDKDTKSNFRVQYLDKDNVRHLGGNRYSTSVGGSLTGFHGHILIVDDPINPREAMSQLQIATANHWMSQTLSTRKIDKAVTPTILIMQRLHEEDPTGSWLNKRKENVKHICLPGEIMTFQQYVKPQELVTNYVDGLLDPKRMPLSVLHDLEADLGQYGYAGQIGQNPVPPGGGMFKVDNFSIVNDAPPRNHTVQTIRYWDKAGTAGGGAYTCGVKMSRLHTGKYVVEDVKRGQWATERRESIIRSTAEADGENVIIYMEQEPGSGGKDSIYSSITNLAGFVAYADRPTGDKAFRADPYSVQVNNGNVQLLRGEWNNAFIEEHRYFPYGRFKDQVDGSSGAFNKLASKRFVRRIT